ncbi:hypothetical protein JCM13210_01020 [Thermaerobacter litoralis]
MEGGGYAAEIPWRLRHGEPPRPARQPARDRRDAAGTGPAGGAGLGAGEGDGGRLQAPAARAGGLPGRAVMGVTLDPGIRDAGALAGAGSPSRTPFREPEVDASWEAGLRAGDPAALQRLAEHWAPRLYRYALRLGADPEAAQDLVQDTLVRALGSFRAGRIPGRLGPWLYTILTNRLRDDARSAYRQRVALAAALPEGPPPWHAGSSPDGAAVDGPGCDPAEVVAWRAGHAARAERLRAALGTLPEPWRQVVVLRILEERPVAEVAAILGVAEGTVKSRLHRALKSLRQALEELDREPEPAGQGEVTRDGEP